MEYNPETHCKSFVDVFCLSFFAVSLGFLFGKMGHVIIKEGKCHATWGLQRKAARRRIFHWDLMCTHLWLDQPGFPLFIFSTPWSYARGPSVGVWITSTTYMYN